jgi:hypothetical protein
MLRRIYSLLAALVLILLVSAPAVAGGWATIVIDDAVPEPPPIEGRPIEVGFTVLQHGQTPIDWEAPTVHFRDVVSGATMDASAKPSGQTGHYVATVTIMAAGFWEWTVELRDLVTDPLPSSPVLAVYDANGRAPTLDPATILGAIDRVRAEAAGAAQTRIDGAMSSLEAEIASHQGDAARIAALSDAVATERAAIDGRLTTLEATSTDVGTTMAMVVLVALLAGGAGGFAMAWLAGRPVPRPVAVSDGSRPGSMPG